MSLKNGLEKAPNIPHLEYVPIKTVEDMKKLNALILDDAEFSNLVKVFGLLGGRDYSEATRKVLAKLIDEKLAVNLNWNGTEKKGSFKECNQIIQLMAVCV